MDAQDPFVPMPMPDPPWSERVSVLVAAHVADGETVSWSHGDDALWLDELEQSGLAAVLGDAMASESSGVVASVRRLGPHYVVVLDGHRADEMLALAIPLLERIRGPLPAGSRAVLTRRDGEATGLRVDMVDLA
jgi:hypothetical protein